MCGGLLKRLEGWAELFDHDRDESVEGAEEALDWSIAEGEISEGNNGIATNLRAGTGLVGMQMMDLALNLEKRERENPN